MTKVSNNLNDSSKQSEVSEFSLTGGVKGGRSCTVHCPATVANLVCGFDILGMALNEPYDIMTMKFIDGPGVVIHNNDDFNLPTEAEKNVAGVVLLSIIEKLNYKVGFEVSIEKHIKPGSGIGSSAASAAGAAVAANHLLGNIFSANESFLSFTRATHPIPITAWRSAGFFFTHSTKQLYAFSNLPA